MNPQQTSPDDNNVTAPSAPPLPPTDSRPSNEPPTSAIDESHQDAQSLSWQASEYIHHEKDAVWFGALAAIAFLLLLIDIFLIRSITFGILIVVMTVGIVVMSVRPPRTLRYQLTTRGMQINDTHYDFHEFKAFDVIKEGSIYYVTLLPTKRFIPSIDIHFPQEYGEQIVDIIGGSIPMQPIKPDAIDRLAKKIRF